MSESIEDANAISPNCYRIGVVSRLTGIEPVTLRAWERRYDVVDPFRSAGGGRLYSQNDIGRLAVLKKLVDDGHSIGSIARLPTERLVELNRPKPIVGSATPATTHRIVGLGVALSAWLQPDRDEPAAFQVLAIFNQQESFAAKAHELSPDTIVLEYPTIHEEVFTEINHLLDLSGAERAIVVYGFGRKSVLNHLENDRISLLRAPLHTSELRRLIGARPAFTAGPQPTVSDQVSANTARRFDDAALTRLMQLPSNVQCECPRHLADLLLSLNGFIRYSSECAERSPQDAGLHQRLLDSSRQARALLEDALSEVLSAESTSLASDGVPE